jgi:hypothetical protein
VRAAAGAGYQRSGSATEVPQSPLEGLGVAPEVVHVRVGAVRLHHGLVVPLPGRDEVVGPAQRSLDRHRGATEVVEADRGATGRVGQHGETTGGPGGVHSPAELIRQRVALADVGGTCLAPFAPLHGLERPEGVDDVCR